MTSAIPRETLAAALAELGQLTDKARRSIRPLADERVFHHGWVRNTYVVTFKSCGGHPADDHIRIVSLHHLPDELRWDVQVESKVLTQATPYYWSRTGGAQGPLVLTGQLAPMPKGA